MLCNYTGVLSAANDVNTLNDWLGTWNEGTWFHDFRFLDLRFYNFIDSEHGMPNTEGRSNYDILYIAVAIVSTYIQENLISTDTDSWRTPGFLRRGTTI